ncbi:lactonase family protein [Kaistia dalseonensis]|uniref:6-phosphogluconolactonase n=1 Tax=Kaistia dalseonensis TaxID=410840 RepID=A0ABU0HAK5_9HYPH|nr:lactonase family protein [Kaistia dalseonensis]MCX5496727.1 lactonase family protein [Kaistia dalseonensis]MDQ0439353.1 6-phosphogluconolactonase [Kaistia dalseonensis]
MSKTFAFVGSLNRAMPDMPPAHGDGISVYSFDEASGALALVKTFDGIDNPTFLAIDAEKRRLYASTEWAGRNEGLAVALAIDPETASLSHINMQPTLGSVTCHLSFDRDGAYLFASNYTVADLGAKPGAAVAAYPLRADGSIAPPVASVAHEGADAVLPVETRSHAHSAIVSPDNRYLMVCDLGLDRVMSYALPPEEGKLALAPAPFVALPAGSGPRHLTFHPNGRTAYVINELNNTMSVLGYDAETGGLTLEQTISTLPADFSGTSYCAELALSPDGRFLYGSNRGHHSLVRFVIDGEGRLSLPAWTSTGGAWPRNFTFDPSGRFVLVANQHGDNIVVFRYDPVTGALNDIGEAVQTGTPMRIVFGRF